MEIRTQINKSGRIILPARLRKALNIQPGDEILMRLEGDSIRLIPLHQAVRLAQAAVRRYAPAGTSLVDDLIQTRHEAAQDE
jgi:AbrB family looped-hinge helix DNA binding protein